MGLAWDTISSTQSTPFWQSLATANQLTTPEMAFWLKRLKGTSAAQEAPGGEFTLGGVNNTLFQGDVEFLDLEGGQPSFWLLKVAALSVNGQATQVTSGDSALAAIDTGTTLIGGPSNDVKAFWSAVPGSAPIQDMPGYFSFRKLSHYSLFLIVLTYSFPCSLQDHRLSLDLLRRQIVAYKPAGYEPRPVRTGEQRVSGWPVRFDGRK
jgi:cathepsin D